MGVGVVVSYLVGIIRFFDEYTVTYKWKIDFSVFVRVEFVYSFGT